MILARHWLGWTPKIRKPLVPSSNSLGNLSGGARKVRPVARPVARAHQLLDEEGRRHFFDAGRWLRAVTPRWRRRRPSAPSPCASRAAPADHVARPPDRLGWIGLPDPGGEREGEEEGGGGSKERCVCVVSAVKAEAKAKHSKASDKEKERRLAEETATAPPSLSSSRSLTLLSSH